MIAAGVPVVKLNGTGNDFVLVDERATPLADPVAFAVRVCDRTTGVADAPGSGARRTGADGLLLIGPSERFDARMRVINADGSEAEMCGNGMRCVARYLDERDGLATATVDTLAGPIHTRIAGRAPYRVAVEVNEPHIGAAEPLGYGLASAPAGRDGSADERALVATPVVVGNPHVVVRVADLQRVDVAVDGPRIEHDPRYPHGTNVHFVARAGDGWRVLHWERGAGATQACGTGTVAVAAVLIASGDAVSPVRLRVPGGLLDVTWTPGERATLAGDAVREFEQIVR